MAMIWVLLLACVALGLVLCFRGRSFTFLALGILAALYCRYLWPQYFPEGIWGILVMVILCLLAAGMVHSLYRFGMFAVGAVLGIVAGTLVLGAFPALEGYRWAVLAGCSVALGIFAVFCSDWFVVVATGFGGAVLAVLAATFAVAERTHLEDFLGATVLETGRNVVSVLNRTYLDDKGLIPMIALIVLGIAGVMTQKKEMKI